MLRYLTLGLTVVAGAALLEAALVPGLVIGGAAVLAPKYLPKLRRRMAAKSPAKRQIQAAASSSRALVVRQPATVAGGFKIRRAIAKTITFRIIVTSLDFTVNYVVIGELAAAAGLSAFGLVVGPLFYLAHEAAWDKFGPPGTAIDLRRLLAQGPDETAMPDGPGRILVSRPLAKTITFRSIATVMDFIANYIVVGDLATAAGLSAFAFVVGPFVYFAHERAWDHYDSASAERSLRGS